MLESYGYIVLLQITFMLRGLLNLIPIQHLYVGLIYPSKAECSIYANREIKINAFKTFRNHLHFFYMINITSLLKTATFS